MKNSILLIFTLLILNAKAQDRPKLVIGLVVDQMTNDYLNRFAKDFSDDGFKRLMREGHNFPNTFYNYMTTSTGPGHASIYTGCTPAFHGIIDNVYYDYSTNGLINCISDVSTRGLGKADNLERKSPHNLETSTITDMFSLSLEPESKVIGISIKDRSAILSAGHLADFAFWWDDKNAIWTSSSYYAEKLPIWLDEFHSNHPVSKYLTKWNSSFDMTENEKKAYAFHDQFEAPLVLNTSTTMPYDLEKLALVGGSSLIKTTPFGNTYTLNFAKKAIKSESMGKDEICDFLCLSLSATDYVGHNFGPYSEELRDAYKRLDKDLADFMIFLDNQIGENEYLLFLTSDHGVVPNVSYLKSKKMPVERFNLEELKNNLNISILEKFKVDQLVLRVESNQLYFELSKIEEAGLDVDKVSRFVSDELNTDKRILLALTAHDLTYKAYSEFPAKEMKASYYRGRSGQVLFTFKNYLRSDAYEKGTGHGTVFNYDRNVPLIFFGKNIKQGITYENVEITQIAATLADLLKIQRPPACVSQSLAGKILEN